MTRVDNKEKRPTAASPKEPKGKETNRKELYLASENEENREKNQERENYERGKKGPQNRVGKIMPKESRVVFQK